jgi:hypothetical protein
LLFKYTTCSATAGCVVTVAVFDEDFNMFKLKSTALANVAAMGVLRRIKPLVGLGVFFRWDDVLGDKGIRLGTFHVILQSSKLIQFMTSGPCHEQI